MELISSDGRGIEIIAFAQEDWYDDHPLLLKPFVMNLAEMIAYLQDSDLHWFIPHPFLPGNPLKKIFPDEEKMLKFLEKVPAFEMQNGCYLLLEMFMQHLPWTLLHKMEDHMRKSVQLSPLLVQHGDHAFFAIGSDAHHPQDIGFYVDIPVSSPHMSRKEIYHALVTNRMIEHIIIPNSAFSLRHLLYTAWTAYSESCMKREWRRYAYQHAVFGSESSFH